MAKKVHFSRNLKHVFRYNPKRDIEQCQSGQSIDLNDALRTGVVPATNSPLEQNGIDDPDNILGIVRDKFDGIDTIRAIKKYGKKAEVKSPIATPPVEPKE